MTRYVAIVGILVGTLTQISCKTVSISETTFFRPRPCAAAVSHEPPYEDVRIRLDDAVRVQVLLARQPEPRALLFFFGGNELTHCPGSAGAASQLRARVAEWASELHIDVAFINYRGYGASEGEPSLEQGARDALAVHDALVADDSLAGQPVIAYGQSLGAAFAIHLAAERDVEALVLESPPTTARAVLSRATSWYLKPFIRYRIADPLSRQDNARAIRGVSAPLLVLVGKDDRLTPPHMAEAVVKSSSGRPKVLAVVEGGHANLAKYDDYWRALTSFLENSLAD